MKQVCLLCERHSPNLSLWCQEVYCPAEASPYILDYGEWLGDIEIVKPVTVLRSSVIYEATHQEETVLLKVAHAGSLNRDRLKREAEFLQKIQDDAPFNQYFPKLRPAYAFTTPDADPYGKAVLKGQMLYFYLFDHNEGEPLRDLLEKNPQLWVNHIGWIMVSLTAAVQRLHQHGMFHFGLTPESILVHFDKKPNVPRLLLADLGIVSDSQNTGALWHHSFVPPAYTAPELVDGPAHAYPATDVYGMGIVLYEMLVGQPAFTYKIRSEADVYRAVRRDRRIGMNRLEDVRRVAEIAVQSTQFQPGLRFQSVNELYAAIHGIFGDVPDPERGWWPSTRTMMLVVAAMLAIAFLVLVAMSLTEIAA